MFFLLNFGGEEHRVIGYRKTKKKRYCTTNTSIVLVQRKT